MLVDYSSTTYLNNEKYWVFFQDKHKFTEHFIHLRIIDESNFSTAFTDAFGIHRLVFFNWINWKGVSGYVRRSFGGGGSVDRL